MRRLLAIAAVLLWPAICAAQTVLPFQLPAQTVVGRPNINPGQATAIPYNQLATGLVPFMQSNGGIRIRLTAPLTLYANFSSGSDANNCTLPSAPCKTVQQAYNQLVSNYDTAGFPVTISFANNDSTCVSIGTGWTGGGQVTIQGPGGSPPAVGLTCSGIAIGINVQLPAALFLTGFKISGGTIGVFSQAPGFIVANNLNFGTESIYHIQLSGPGAKYLCNGNYTISGNATYHWYASSTGALIQCAQKTLTLSGTPAFGIFAVAIDGGAIQPTLNTYSGSATGPRFAVGSQGLIDTGTGNQSLLPGDSAGVIGAGGFYN